MLSEDTVNELMNKFSLNNSSTNDGRSKTARKEQSFFKQRPVTRLDILRQSIGKPHAEIDYDLIAGIIADMADYAELLFNHPITSITFVSNIKERELFNRLFLGSDRTLVVELQRGACTIYVLCRRGVIIHWKTAMHIIRLLHDSCNGRAHDFDQYSELIKTAHESGWISNKFRAVMEKPV